MGPAASRLRGMGGFGGASAQGTPPINPGAGSGGAGVVGIDTAGNAFDTATGEINDILAGRITLGMVAVSVVVLAAFYVYTRGSQNGA